MKRMMNLLLSAMLLFAFIACNNPQSAINNLESLVERIEKNSDEYSEEDWEEISEEYDDIQKELEKHEYSEEQLKKIGRLQGKCMALMSKKVFQNAGKAIDNFGKQMEGALEGFMDEMSEEE